MNLSQITAFQAVMTSPTLTEAASKLGRTQPAVSAAIKALEEQLGLKLFEREGRKLTPVPEAQYLLTETDEILAQMSRVRRTMRSLVDGQTGNLNVAAMPGPVSMLFPRFIASQIEGHADITVSMLARSSQQIEELVRAQSIDFGFADAPEGAVKENLYRVEFITADCFIALPAAHVLVSKPQITLQNLDGEPMGSLQSTHAHQGEVRSLFAAHDLTFRTMVESQTFLPILQFVSAGQCSCILDPLTVVHMQANDAAMKGIEIRPLAERIRYKYTIFSPRYRPVSVLANRLRGAWRDEVMRLLRDLGARPSLLDE